LVGRWPQAWRKVMAAYRQVHNNNNNNKTCRAPWRLKIQRRWKDAEATMSPAGCCCSSWLVSEEMSVMFWAVTQYSASHYHAVCCSFQMLSTVLNIIMFEDCRNQWSMSRPLLGLILLNEEVCICYRPSVCPSVCLSVTRVDQSKTVERIIEILSPSDRSNILVFRHQRSLRKSDGFTPNGGAKYKGGSKN